MNEPVLYPCPRCGKPYSFVPPDQWHVDPAVCKECRMELRKWMHRQHVVFLVGPDMCGKTNIATAVAARTTIPYFKASSEHGTYLKKKDLFINQLRYADMRVHDLLRQTCHSVIFDRGYPCEWAYSQVFDRKTDMKVLAALDAAYAALGAWVIVCRRKSYAGIVDDIDAGITEKVLQRLDAKYEEFIGWTQCKTLSLYVDDEDLEREVSDIIKFIQETP